MREFTQSYASFAPQGFYANPANFEIKGSLLAHLPKFTGFPHEDAHTHLLGLYHTCSSMKPPNANLDDVLLRVFQFSLEGKAKEWFLNLPTHYATLSWEQLKKVFLDRYFPLSKISKLRKDITGVQQLSQETFYDYWSRFNTLVNSCPNHNISKANLVQYFYDGLVPQLKMSVDAASNGSIFNLSANEGWTLFSTMASNHQNFYGRDVAYGGAPRVASLSGDDKLYNSIERLTESLSRMDGRFVKPTNFVDVSMALVATSCDHCGSPMHTTSSCPSYEECAALYNNPRPQAKYDPYSSTYNPGWRDHPNFKWGEVQTKGKLQVPSNHNNNLSGGEAKIKSLMLFLLNKAMVHTKGGITLILKGIGRINKPMFFLHL